MFRGPRAQPTPTPPSPGPIPLSSRLTPPHLMPLRPKHRMQLAKLLFVSYAHPVLQERIATWQWMQSSSRRMWTYRMTRGILAMPLIYMATGTLSADTIIVNCGSYSVCGFNYAFVWMNYMLHLLHLDHSIIFGGDSSAHIIIAGVLFVMYSLSVCSLFYVLTCMTFELYIILLNKLLASLATPS